MVEAQALDHALRNALVESVLPSDLAPKLTTLYVAPNATDEHNQQPKITRRVIRRLGLGFGVGFVIFFWKFWLSVEDDLIMNVGVVMREVGRYWSGASGEEGGVRWELERSVKGIYS